MFLFLIPFLVSEIAGHRRRIPAIRSPGRTSWTSFSPRSPFFSVSVHVLRSGLHFLPASLADLTFFFFPSSLAGRVVAAVFLRIAADEGEQSACPGRPLRGGESGATAAACCGGPAAVLRRGGAERRLRPHQFWAQPRRRPHRGVRLPRRRPPPPQQPRHHRRRLINSFLCSPIELVHRGRF